MFWCFRGDVICRRLTVSTHFYHFLLQESQKWFIHRFPYLAPLWWQSEKVQLCRLQLLPVKGNQSAALKRRSATENISKNRETGEERRFPNVCVIPTELHGLRSTLGSLCHSAVGGFLRGWEIGNNKWRCSCLWLFSERSPRRFFSERGRGGLSSLPRTPALNGA